MFNKGDQLDKYIIDEPLGDGSFGCVYKAAEGQGGNISALKICKLNISTDDLNRFEQENGILHSLMPHPRIITPLSLILHHTVYTFYSMELADNNLHNYLNLQSGLDIKDKINLFIKICEGLKHAHGKGIVHRDLWWNNILIKKNFTHNIDEPKITDFGRAKDFSVTDLTSSPQGIWGHIYICPHEKHFKIWDTATRPNYILGDMYALGIIFCFIVQSAPTYYALKLNDNITSFFSKNSINLDTLTLQQKQTHYQQWLNETDFSQSLNELKVTIIDKNLNDEINKIILKLCQPDFSKRYANIDSLLNDLSKL